MAVDLSAMNCLVYPRSNYPHTTYITIYYMKWSGCKGAEGQQAK